jgi:hypothetical protein
LLGDTTFQQGELEDCLCCTENHSNKRDSICTDNTGSLFEDVQPPQPKAWKLKRKTSGQSCQQVARRHPEFQTRQAPT